MSFEIPFIIIPHTTKLLGGYIGFTLSVRLSVCMLWGLFILRDVRQSLEYPCALRVLRTSPHGFLDSSNDSITLDMLFENDGNFGEVINGTDVRPDSTHLS